MPKRSIEGYSKVLLVWSHTIVTLRITWVAVDNRNHVAQEFYINRQRNDMIIPLMNRVGLEAKLVGIGWLLDENGLYGESHFL